MQHSHAIGRFEFARKLYTSYKNVSRSRRVSSDVKKKKRKKKKTARRTKKKKKRLKLASYNDSLTRGTKASQKSRVQCRRPRGFKVKARLCSARVSKPLEYASSPAGLRKSKDQEARFLISNVNLFSWFFDPLSFFTSIGPFQFNAHYLNCPRKNANATSIVLDVGEPAAVFPCCIAAGCSPKSKSIRVFC